LLRDDPSFDLRLFVGGMHLHPKYGMTVRHIEEDGFRCDERLGWLEASQEPEIGWQASRALEQMATALARHNPEFLLLMGDRYETASAALAATLTCVPVVHLHGGEETEGAFDNVLRHAITKMSHFHLVSHCDYAARVVRMGEEPCSVHVVGAPGVDNLFRSDLPGRPELEQALGIRLDPPVVLVSVHPATLAQDVSAEVKAVIAAMSRVKACYVISLPNCDPGNELIRSPLQQFAMGRAGVVVTEALGDRTFPAMLHIADAMLGNSSAAVIEASALGVPAVNVGDRQKGRRMTGNVISVRPIANAVEQALVRALTLEFRRIARGGVLPFGGGNSGERIVSLLREWKPPCPPRKRFFELPAGCQQS
jgi:UDP-hydrolysing UDP-N-acetyl-D-glucosamine 2-epimerase